MRAWGSAWRREGTQTSERPALETVRAASIAASAAAPSAVSAAAPSAASAVAPSAASMAAAIRSLLVNSNSTRLTKQKNRVLGHSYLHSINPINYKEPATSLLYKITLRVDKISICS